MITPRFKLSQEISTLTITIRAPYCNLKELDVSVENNEFIFVCSPYYLRLSLPGNIVENASTKSSFDSNSSEFTFAYQKEILEEFANLDFITKFLQPKVVEVSDGSRIIEVLTSAPEQHTDTLQDSSIQYGFALRGGYNFQNVNSEFSELFSIDPYNVAFSRRRGIRIQSEKEKFDSEHYIADIMDDMEISEIINIKCLWTEVDKNNIQFNDKELDILKNLPNVQYNLTSQQINYCYNSLIEILYAYCYDRRTTFYEGTCESGWTISTISASLSCFDSFSDPKDAIICAYRRSLIYPLYRSFKLCEKVFDDLKCLLRLGNKYIIQCLIDMHSIFLHGGSARYVLNKLFIEDYIVYMMKCDISVWTKLINITMGIKMNKSELGLNLEDIEKSIENSELTVALNGLNIDDDEDSDDTSTSESDSDSDSSDSDDSGNNSSVIQNFVETLAEH